MVEDTASAAALGAGVFVATNLDDIFLLLTFFADRKQRASHVVAGQFLGIGLLTAASVVCALTAVVIPKDYLGLLGLLPLAIGIKKLVELKRGTGDDAGEAPPRDEEKSALRNVLAVALVTIANGGDNVGVYVPVFATHPWVQVLVMVVVFAVLTGVWCVVAYALVNHRTFGDRIRRVGHVVLPFVLILVGLHILAGSRALVGL